MKKLIGLVTIVVVTIVAAAGVLTAIPARPAQAAPADGGLPTVTWLPPLSNQGEFQLKDGSTLPIKFTLTDPDTGAFVEDTSLRVDVNQVLFRDDFNDGDLDGWTPVEGDIFWSVVDGVLHCTDGAFPRILADETMGYTHYVFEADARLTSGQGYALLFRATDHDNFYSFQYDPGIGDKLRLCQFAGLYNYTDVAPMVDYTIDSQWHHLKVVVIGDHIRCYIDGNKVFDVTDTVPPAPTEGGIGFRTWGYSQAEFDNVTVVSLPAAESFTYGTGGDNLRIYPGEDVGLGAGYYIANLNTKESEMTPGEYLITVWSGSGDQLGTYLFDLTDAIQGIGRGMGKA